MQVKRILSATALVGLLVLPAIGFAQPESIPETVTTPDELLGLIEKIGNWIFAFLLAVAGIFLVYAGFLWVTAGGNPENVTKARTMLINALIGVVIALLSKGLVSVVRGVIEG